MYGCVEMRFPQLVVFLILTWSTGVKPVAVLTVATEVAKSTLELLIRSIDQAWEIVNRYGQFLNITLTKQENMLFEKIYDISLRLDELNEKIDGNDIRKVEQILSNLPQRFRYELQWEELRNCHFFINVNYERMQRFVRDIEKYGKSTVIDYCNNVVSQSDNSVLYLNELIYKNVVTTDFLKLFSQQLQEINGDILCNEQKSPQQLLYNLLNEFLLTNSRSYTVIQFAYMTKKMYGQGNFTKEAEDATEAFKMRINNMITVMKPYMVRASRELWRCDPHKHVLGETYMEITNLIRGHILNKVNLDPKGECKQNCDAYKYTNTQDCRGNNWCQNKEKYCPKIVNCQLIDSEMTVCRANIDRKRNYEYVAHENGRVFGNNSYCRNNQKTVLSSYTYWMFWTCSYCFCLCDVGEKFFSDRFINLRASIANMNDNRVVTGLRFVKRNRIIHLQIQEGKLLPGGSIDIRTVRWKPVDNYKITDPYTVVKGQDYHTLSWEERAIDLNNVMADEGHIVTGVRFRKVGTRLDLEVLTTPFNFTTGQLIEPYVRSFYKDSPNTPLKHKFGREIKLIKPDIPTRSQSPSIPDTSIDKYIKFTNSDYDKDAAQTTVPFIDAQPVASLLPVPLSGVGIYYKGQRGYGGFIAPKIFTYDFSQHLGPLFEKAEERDG